MNQPQFAFECMVNVLNSNTHCDSLTSTSTSSVIGVPMIGHDVFHEVGNNLVRKALTLYPDSEQKLVDFGFDLDNPAAFNYNGERLAMIAQEYIKAFCNNSKCQDTISAPIAEVPTYYNIHKLSNLLAFDIKSSFSIASYQFRLEYLTKLNEIFLTTEVLTKLIKHFVNSNCNQIQTLFSYFAYAYSEHHPDYKDIFFNNFQRFGRSSINAQEFLAIIGINSDNPDSTLVSVLVDRIHFYSKDINVYNKIIEDQRLYTFYTNVDAKHFSLREDIYNYFQSSMIAPTLAILETEFEVASGMNWNIYLNGSRYVANLFDSVYLSDFAQQLITIADQTITFAKTEQLSLLECDMIKYNQCCLTLNSYNIVDFVARSGIHQETKELRQAYLDIISPFAPRIAKLEELCSDPELSYEQFQILDVEREQLQTNLSNLMKLPSTRVFTDQLIKYYGYCDL